MLRLREIISGLRAVTPIPETAIDPTQTRPGERVVRILVQTLQIQVASLMHRLVVIREAGRTEVTLVGLRTCRHILP